MNLISFRYLVDISATDLHCHGVNHIGTSRPESRLAIRKYADSLICFPVAYIVSSVIDCPILTDSEKIPLSTAPFTLEPFDLNLHEFPIILPEKFAHFCL